MKKVLIPLLLVLARQLAFATPSYSINPFTGKLDMTNLDRLSYAVNSATSPAIYSQQESKIAGQLAFWQPPGFSWLPFAVRRSSTTGAPEAYLPSTGATFNISSLRPTGAGKTYYVGYGSASDSNVGTSTSTAFATISTATLKTDVDIIMIYPKRYYRSGNTGLSPTRNISFIASSDGVNPSTGVIIGVDDSLTWSKVAGTTNTYTQTRSAVGWVWDASILDSAGDYSRLTQVSSLTYVSGEMTSTGTFTVFPSSFVVRPADDRNLVGDTNMHAFLNVHNGLLTGITGGLTVYYEGINFEGGQEAMQATNGGSASKPVTIYAKNCTFKYTNLSDAVQIQGANAGFQNCVAAQGYTDGFNYHAANSVNVNSFEIGCTGRNNGFSGGDANQGSTTHDGNSVVRVNGLYYGNDGGQITDVNANTTSWNVGCGAYGSTAGTGSTANNCYQVDNSGGTMWLDSCWCQVDTSATGKYGLVQGAGTSMYFRNFSGPVQPSIGATGTFQSY